MENYFRHYKIHLILLLIITFCFSCLKSDTNIESNTYTNSFIGITLSFPQDWKIRKNDPIKEFDFSAVHGKKELPNNDDARFNLVYNTIDKNISLTEAVEDHKKILIEMYGDKVIFEKPKEININGKNIISLYKINNSIQSYISKSNTFYIINNNYYIVFGFSTQESSWYLIENDIEFIIKTMIIN